MQFPFSASDGWIADVFAQLRCVDWRASLQADAAHGTWLLALLHHDGLGEPGAYLRAQRDLHASHAMQLLPRATRSADLHELLQATLPVVGLPRQLRRGDVRIRSTNALSQRFRLPTAERARQGTGQVFAHRQHPAGGLTAGDALASYLCLLTLHPLRDGNGRTFRALFAADLASSPCHAHWWLALVLLHRDRNRAFHLATRGARSGVLSLLVEEMQGCLDRVAASFAGDIRMLSATAGAAAADVERVGLSLQRRLRHQLAW